MEKQEDSGRSCVQFFLLQLNEGLKYLDVSMNGFGLEGARAMEDALKTNRILRELHCTHCRIPVEGAPYIAAGIQVNEALVKLYVSNKNIEELLEGYRR